MSRSSLLLGDSRLRDGRVSQPGARMVMTALPARSLSGRFPGLLLDGEPAAPFMKFLGACFLPRADLNEHRARRAEASQLQLAARPRLLPERGGFFFALSEEVSRDRRRPAAR